MALGGKGMAERKLQMERAREGHGRLESRFEEPPRGYGVVPFYWWMGDKLTRERIGWHLEKMRGHAVSGLQINYAHGFSGGNSYGLTLESNPALFTDEWWELFQWFLGKGKEEGISVSLSDYTLGSPGQGWYTDEILSACPDMAGWLLREERMSVKEGRLEGRDFPDGMLSVHIITEKGMRRISLEALREEASFAGMEDATIVIVYAEQQPYSMNPMHPQAGKEVCRRFFGRFEEHAPGECGRALDFFFSDELNFGISGKLWDAIFQEEFRRRKGYDICDYLPCLFGEYEPYFAKIRLDYYDVIVSREEENYFKVVYDWHEERNMVYGCDHGGRGYDLTEFGDYFQTQKFNQGPGCDQPNLASDIVKNKVASSISHLYARKRTWLEGFYGSGWGTSGSEFMDAVARNFVMGHNLLSVHGMYYSTHGGWWEWAPPCNTYHMPYWDDMGNAFRAIERMSYMLSQGVHRCDIAVLYPVMAAEGGIEADRAAQTAFDSVRSLYEKGIDVDFIDHRSVLEAEIRDGRLEKQGEAYRIIILPEMRTVRIGVMRKLDEFCSEGGMVWGIGEPPSFGDSWDSEELRHCLGRIRFGVKVEELADMVGARLMADVIFPAGTDAKKYMLHRFIEGEDFYMVYGGKAGDEYGFHAKGNPVFWNPYDGKRYAVPAREQGEYLFVRLPLSGSELQLISFSRRAEALPQWRELPEERRELPLSDEWDFSLLPCLDNRFGDYSLPASDEMVGPQVRAMRWIRSDCREPGGFLDGGAMCRCGFGPYYLKKAPFADRKGYLAAVAKAAGGDREGFLPYEVSMRFGKWDDPGVQGYHGLKGSVSDAFLVMGEKKETMTGTEYVREEDGAGYIFATAVRCGGDCEAHILYGDMEPEFLFVDGVRVMDLKEKLRLSRGDHQVVAAYRDVGRTYLLFAKGEIGKQEYPLSMRWYAQKNLLPMDGLLQGADGAYDWFSFEAPPALERMEMLVNGEAKVWIDGSPARQEEKREAAGPGLQSRLAVYPTAFTQRMSTVTIRVKSRGICSGGACFEEPIRLYCGEGRLKYGDWGEIDGLAFYSGKAVYGQTVEIGEEEIGRRMILEIDDISASARVSVNGHEAGVRVSAPWRFDLTPFLEKGRNELRICVSNTLTNHYRSIPTRYRGDAPSGILGKARILICPPCTVQQSCPQGARPSDTALPGKTTPAAS